MLSGLSSMATRALLAELVSIWDGAVEFTAIGGTEAAQRVRDGAALDVVVLAESALRSLEAEGLIRPGSRQAVVLSSMAVAVREGCAAPDLRSVDGFRRWLPSAGRIGYSTGPSGEHLLRLVGDWGLTNLALVQAPPGMPVGRLLAEGSVDLAVQQRSELIGIAGTVLVGDLPAGAGSETVFAAAVPTASERPKEAARLVEFLAGNHGGIKQRHGMRPVEDTPCPTTRSPVR